MAANHQGIVHYGPKGRAFCGRLDAHEVIREASRFDVAPRQCKRCASKLAEARERTRKLAERTDA